MNIPKVSIFGIPISKMNMEETIQYLCKVIEVGTPHQIITANPIMVMAALEHTKYMHMMKEADLIVPDGTGIVWAAGYIGNPVKERVPGIELMHHMLRKAEVQGWKAYFIGASPDVLQTAVDNIQKQFPKLQIVGFRDGYFSEEQDAEVIKQIREAQPELLFVGRSADKQEPWIHRFKQQLGVPVIMGVGGSYDVISGKLKRAPKLYQKLRLEWLYRLIQEPWRYKRMLDLPKFAVRVIANKKNVQKP